MSFQSLHFLVFALAVFTANALLLRRFEWRKNMLLGASYYFYMCWDWRFAGLLLAVTAVNYLAGRKMAAAADAGVRKAWLMVALVAALGALAFFKYAGFFVGSAASLLASLGLHADLPTLSVLLPIGISFFTFQGIAYTVDVYRRQQDAVTDFRDFALFIAFFPTLLSGPITRGRQLLPQLAAARPYRAEAAQEGFFLILKGLAKKVFIADVLALHIVDPAFGEPGAYGPSFLAVAVIAYSFQIYMDLSGYTDMVRGIARTLGFELPGNFDRPYLARSVSSFWQRWHTSMSGFFRDYLYFGVGGSKRGNVYLNLLITFAAIGMWHGAGWNFLLYGLLHGGVVGLERYFRNRGGPGLAAVLDARARAAFAIVATFLFVASSRILFRADDFDAARSFVGALWDNAAAPTPLPLPGLVALGAAVLLHWVPKSWPVQLKRSFVRSPAPVQACLTLGLILGALATSPGSSSFLYFRF